MFVKRHVVAFSALNLLVGLAAAQSIFDKAPKADKPEATKPAAAAALATLTSAAPAAAPAVPVPAKPTPPTIKELADKQAAALAAEASKPAAQPPAAASTPAPVATNPVQGQIIGELIPTSPIPVSMQNPPKELKPIPEKKAPPPPPPRPYFAALVGFKGKEIAEVHIGSRVLSLKAGDSINQWKITGVVDGRLMLSGTSSKKVKGKTVSVATDRALSVGDFL